MSRNGEKKRIEQIHNTISNKSTHDSIKETGLFTDDIKDFRHAILFIDDRMKETAELI